MTHMATRCDSPDFSNSSNLLLMPKTLDINTPETWLWGAASKIRGEVDAPKYKDYILPLIFLKRLSDVFDDEMKGMQDEYGNMKIAEDIAPVEEAIVLLKEAEEERAGADKKLKKILGNLGF